MIAATNPPPSVPVPDTPPEGLVMQGRITNLRMSWANADRLLVANGGSPIGASPEVMALGFVGPALADIVDLGAPLDVGIFGEGSDRFVLSLGVDPDVAPRLGRLFTWEPEDGMLRITGTRGEESPFEPMLPACALTNPDEDTSQRLVCASDEDLLHEAGGYMGRKVAREPGEGDVRLELDASRLFADLANEASEPNESAAEAAGDALGKSFLRDIGRLSFVGAWGKNEIDAEMVLGFPRNGSAFSQVLTARPSAQTPPPSVFARLPRDAAVALYGQGANARSLSPLRDELLRALLKDMVEEGYDQGLLDVFGEKVSALFFTGGPIAVAVGVDRAGAEKALVGFQKDEQPREDEPKPKDKPKAKGKEDPRAAAFRALRSWTVVGVEEPFETWSRGLMAIIDAGNAVDAKKNGTSKAGAGGATTTPTKPGKKDKDRETTTILPVKPSPSAPKGSLHLEIRVKPLVPDAPPAHVTHMYVMADGSRTWIGVGEDEASVLARLSLTREGAPEKTIAGMPELDLTRTAGASAGGFFTLAGATQFFLDDDRDADLPIAAAKMQGLATLPSRGETIIPWVLVAEDEPRGGSRVRIKAHLVVPALADMMALSKR